MTQVVVLSFRKLKAAKEKLRRLQDLVTMVQQSPDIANGLPDDLAELAAGFDSDILSELAELNQEVSEQKPKRSPEMSARATQQQQLSPAAGTSSLNRQPSPAAAGAVGGVGQTSPSLAMSAEER